MVIVSGVDIPDEMGAGQEIEGKCKLTGQSSF